MANEGWVVSAFDKLIDDCTDGDWLAPLQSLVNTKVVPVLVKYQARELLGRKMLYKVFDHHFALPLWSPPPPSGESST